MADETARSYFESLGAKVAGEDALWDGRHGIMPYNRHSEKRVGTFQREISEWVLAVGEHEGVIESERFVRIQQRIAANKERYNSFSSTTNDYALLSGLLYCAKCGKRMYTKPPNKKGRGASADSWFYVCETQKKYTSKACSCNAVLGRRIDEAVLKAFDEAFVPETELSAQLENLRPNHLRKKEEGVEKARLEKRKMEIDKEQHTVHPISAAGIDFRQVLVQISGKNESLIQPGAILFKVGFAHPAIVADTLLGSFWKFKIREIIVSVKGIMNAVFDDFLFQRCHGDDLLCHNC